MDGGQEEDVTADSKETVGVNSNGVARINLTYVILRSLEIWH
jgi:hypothetical protein